MAKSLPTILFVAGAYADPSCFDTLSEHLHKAGYPTSYAYVNSLNPSDPSSVSTSKDSEEVRNKYVLPLLEDGKEVVIFVHSYGGVVGGQAARGLSKRARSASGKPGGIIGLIYLVGNIVGEGETLLQAVGGAYPPFIKIDYPSPGLSVIDPMMDTLYNDVDPSHESKLQEGMIPHAHLAFETPAGPPAWAESGFDGRRAYIRTKNDQTNPFFLQNIWLDKSGVEWDIVDLETSHCPFISRPEETAKTAIGFIEKWI